MQSSATHFHQGPSEIESMTTDTHSSSIFLIQELVETLVSHLSDEESLKACSLVCHRFVACSQKRLFSVIIIDSYDTYRAFDQLLTHTSSNHLAKYVRELYLYEDIHSYESESEVMESETRLVSILTRLPALRYFWLNSARKWSTISFSLQEMYRSRLATPEIAVINLEDMPTEILSGTHHTRIHLEAISPLVETESDIVTTSLILSIQDEDTLVALARKAIEIKSVRSLTLVESSALTPQHVEFLRLFGKTAVELTLDRLHLGSTSLPRREPKDILEHFTSLRSFRVNIQAEQLEREVQMFFDLLEPSLEQLETVVCRISYQPFRMVGTATESWKRGIALLSSFQAEAKLTVELYLEEGSSDEPFKDLRLGLRFPNVFTITRGRAPRYARTR